MAQERGLSFGPTGSLDRRWWVAPPGSVIARAASALSAEGRERVVASAVRNASLPSEDGAPRGSQLVTLKRHLASALRDEVAREVAPRVARDDRGAARAAARDRDAEEAEQRARDPVQVFGYVLDSLQARAATLVQLGAGADGHAPPQLSEAQAAQLAEVQENLARAQGDIEPAGYMRTRHRVAAAAILVDGVARDILYEHADEGICVKPLTKKQRREGSDGPYATDCHQVEPGRGVAHPEDCATVRAHLGRLRAPRVSDSKSVFHGAFVCVWVRRALNGQNRWFPARAGSYYADGDGINLSCVRAGRQRCQTAPERNSRRVQIACRDSQSAGA